MVERVFRATLAASFLTFALLEPVGTRAGDRVDDLVRFGTEMALNGNWREARYRWERAAMLEAGDPRIANNIAVAAEVLGDPEGARASYRRATALSDDEKIRENALRAARFWDKIAPADPAEGGGLPEPPPRRGKTLRGDVEVTVQLPVPPRLDVRDKSSVLVASFLVDDRGLIDANREIVRFIRSEFRKHTPLEVLDVTPPPAVPEQTVEAMVANAAFWSHLGRESDAQLVVSGVLNYDRSDASGFQDVDYVDERTGHKVRQTRFVEQERFEFVAQVFFFDGASGELLYRDRFQRDAVYRGSANDPITAFYDLSATIASDVLAVVSQRVKPDVRYLFK